MSDQRARPACVGVRIMSVSGAASSSNAYNYLQSILQQQSSASDKKAPMDSLLDAFYPDSSATNTSSSSADASDAGTRKADGGCAIFNPGTLGALISLQAGDPIAAKADYLFNGFDGNNDGSISKSEFETTFGSDADTTKVDGLFNAIDGNGDGSISQDEL